MNSGVNGPNPSVPGSLLEPSIAWSNFGEIDWLDKS